MALAPRRWRDEARRLGSRRARFERRSWRRLRNKRSQIPITIRALTWLVTLPLGCYIGSMFSRNQLLGLVSVLICFLSVISPTKAEHACVWKVTAPRGGTLYLGGSLRPIR